MLTTLLSLALASAEPQPDARTSSVVVMPVEAGDGVGPAVAEQARAAVLDELGKQPGLRVLRKEDLPAGAPFPPGAEEIRVTITKAGDGTRNIRVSRSRSARSFSCSQEARAEEALISAGRECVKQAYVVRPLVDPRSIKRVQVLPFDFKTGVSSEFARKLDARLLAATQARPQLTVSVREDIAGKAADSQQAQAEGRSNVATLAAPDVHAILRGTVGKLGGTYILNVTLFDVRSGEPKNVSRRLKGTEEDVLAAIPGVVDELFGPNP